ncbi:tetratricopeptide repeat protein [Paraburkholderia agricolaris]|uniref:tetratricopeptide repeat protein n=1 Tax=Paraburkholderia agricolaris TaxID=2152888 RepID=UPI001FE7BB5B|nr:tetratricopeptide repeat protein [Paraburkholderia agricolaris]
MNLTSIKRKQLRVFALLPLIFLSFAACSMDDLPRNMSLKAFDPHRADFVCKHEADAVPPVDPEAEKWFEEGLSLTSPLLWPDKRDYKKAVELWTKAADRQHWKAMINLANAYAEGEGVDRDTEHAVQIVEAAMKLGIPAAFDLMGTYHMNGVGVKQDASRAYAFWELAADKGSPSAQAYIGSKLVGTYDDPKAGFWGNRKIALKMLECGVAQGNGDAAYALGVTLKGTRRELDEDNQRAVRVLQEGVKFGNADSANYLFSVFNNGDVMVNHVIDHARAERYNVLGDVLERNPDLRFPNLDKVLPLPPAPLPKWDGNKQTLIDAAKAVVPKVSALTEPASHSIAQLSGRAHIPEGFTLPAKPLIAVPAQYETTAAPVTGYWLAQLTHPRSERHTQWNTQQVALRYEKDELFDRTRPGLVPEDGRLLFHYVGEPIPQAIPASANTHPRVAQGLAREATFAEPAIQCRGTRACPSTGIWQGTVSADHPQAATFNQWYRQAYVLQGQPFPDPRDVHLSVEPNQITWVWWNQANHLGFGKIPQVSVGDQVLEA